MLMRGNLNSQNLNLEETNRSQFMMALKHSIPLMVGLIPFGIAYGIMARQAGLTLLESYLMSLLVFAGAAQFTAVSMLNQDNVQISLILTTTLLINLRHLLMGASLAPYLQKLSLKWQALLAFGMVDESYALTITRFTEQGTQYSYQLGVNLAIYFAWTSFSGIGALLGGIIEDPLKWGLDFAMPATFIALLAPQIKGWKEIVVCITAIVVGLAGALYIPGKWYIIIATIVGTIVGGGLEECERK